MEEKELNVNIDYLVEKGLVNYTDGDIVLLNSNDRAHVERAVRLEMVTIGFVEKGEMQCDINGFSVKAVAGDLVICPPNSFINKSKCSPDYEVKLMALSYKAMRKSLIINRDVWNIMAYVARNPVIHLSGESRFLIDKYYSLIRYKIDNPHGYYHKEIMQSLFHCMFYELAAIIAPNLDVKRMDAGFRQGELLFHRFIEMLANVNGSDRSVKSYAERLCVTPKYLSTVCKSVSGKTALEWIHEYIAEQVTQKLKYSDMSVKEIADSLGFPNISFFGKFVKSRFGASPKEYRYILQNSVPKDDAK